MGLSQDLYIQNLRHGCFHLIFPHNIKLSCLSQEDQGVILEMNFVYNNYHKNNFTNKCIEFHILVLGSK